MSLARRRKFLLYPLILGWAFLSFSGTAVEPDRSRIDPALIATDLPAVRAVQRKIAEDPARPDAEVPVFIRLRSDDPSFPDRVRDLGGAARRVAPRLYIGQIPRDAARYLSNRPDVVYIEAAKRARPLLNLSAPAISAHLVQAGVPGWPPPFDAGIRGGNVYVGIVDTGLSGSHPDFSGRIAHTFSFSPATVNPLVDTNGHGTHVAGIAAGDGTGSSGQYTGMAPRAQLLVGRAGIDEFPVENIFSALNSFFAFTGNSPVAVNLSLGLATGPHDGTSSFETAINSYATSPAGSRRLIAVAAGNERTEGEHIRRVLPPFGSVTEFLTLEDVFRATVEIYADGEDWYTVTATMGSESVTLNTKYSTGSNTSPTNLISIWAIKLYPLNNTTFITVFFYPQFAGQSGNIQLTRTRNGGSGRLDGYIDVFDGTFDTPTESGTITEPANADNVIAVGSFNTKNYPSGTPSATMGISPFSSLGPTRDGRTKPDVTAPGLVIYSARSFDAPIGNYNLGLVPGNDNYAILAGTSMAAPHVTGIAALVWESNPALTGAQMRERLKKTADPPPGAPDNTWGRGKVNALRAIEEPVAAITASSTAVPQTSVSLSSTSSSGAFGSPLAYSWSLASKPSGSGALLASSLPDTSFTPDIPGDYTVALSVSQGGAAVAIDNATIHVNNLPLVTGISGPSSTDNVIPVVFTGTGSDSDNQALTLHWILLAKPPGSNPSLIPVGADNATLSPDLPGDYEIGLRVSDGLDNSALVAKTFTAGGFPITEGGGGGGSCSVTPRENGENIPSTAAAIILLAFPLVYVCIRRPYII